MKVLCVVSTTSTTISSRELELTWREERAIYILVIFLETHLEIIEFQSGVIKEI